MTHILQTTVENKLVGCTLTGEDYYNFVAQTLHESMYELNLIGDKSNWQANRHCNLSYTEFIITIIKYDWPVVVCKFKSNQLTWEINL